MPIISSSRILNKDNKKEKKLQYSSKSEKASRDCSDRIFIDEQVALLEGYNGFEADSHETADIADDLPAKEISDLHEMSISLANEIHVRVARNEIIDCESIKSCVAKLVQILIINNDLLPLLTSGGAEDYLGRHAVNVCILSIKIGIGLGFDKSRLKELGISAFLHDIGMTKYLDLASQPRKLTTKEYEKIKNHPVMSSELLKKAKGLPDIAIITTLQQHERVDGSGYPYGLKGDYINTYAKIINLADTYEALTQTRTYRERYEPFGAMKEILSTKSCFDYQITKTFINMVGIFPVGSLVRLNTGEIGTVAGINRGYPTRPVLHIMYNSQSRKLDKIRVIDLKKQPVSYITECLKESKYI